MRNLRLVLEYDGTDFGGWQRQPNARTVQQVVEEALAVMTGAPVTLRGSGRTDAGVHARAQVANFFTEATIPVEGFRKGLNAALPPDVAIVSADEVPESFDARRAARGKHYRYRLYTRESRSPFHAREAWHVWRPLDLGAMRAAGAALLGEHDFSAFRAADCERKNPVRILRRADVTRDGDLVRMDFEATAFLKNMVRILAGTLVEVGMGRRSAAEIPGVLAGRDRTQAGRTAPAHGLTLEAVHYEDPVRPPDRLGNRPG